MAEVINMPRFGLNETSNLIIDWYVAEGDKVKKDDDLFTIETDKSTMTVPSETDGVVLKRFYNNYEMVDVLTPVCIIGKENEDITDILKSINPKKNKLDNIAVEKNEPIKNAVAAVQDTDINEPEVKPFLSPRANKLALANGMKTFDIKPSGAENRIIEKDVINLMKNSNAKVNGEKCRIVKMSNVRSIIAENMMRSLATTAQLTSHRLFNASEVLEYREKLKNSACNGKHISIGDMILFAIVKTLKEFDYMNAHLINEEEILIFDDINLGFAVDTERGLMVPTIFKAQNMSLPEISAKVKDLSGLCRNGKIAPEDMKGATFTVSNLGSLGVTEFTPILNPPQTGILGIGTIDYAMKKTSKGILYYPSGHLSLTYDHRAVDGAPSARFLKAVCENLENFNQLTGGQ